MLKGQLKLLVKEGSHKGMNKVVSSTSISSCSFACTMYKNQRVIHIVVLKKLAVYMYIIDNLWTIVSHESNIGVYHMLKIYQ